MKYIGTTLFLEVADLVKAGVAYERVRTAKRRGAQGWVFTPDPQDRRRMLVQYDTLGSEVRAAVDAVHGKEAERTREAHWSVQLRVASADLAALRGHVLADGGGLPEDVVQQYAQACAYLRMLAGVKRKQLTLWGYSDAAEYYTDVLRVIVRDDVQLPRTYSRLRSKVRDYRTSGPLSVVSAKWGNQNGRKIGPAQSAWLIAAYAMPTKPDTVKVAVRYAEAAKQHGWPSLTEGAIYTHLHQPDIEPVWWIGRHGKAEWKDRFAHTMSLRGPSFRDALWCSDGTKLNYWYRTDDGQKALLKVYLIIDVFSEAIIGHSFSTKENFQAQYTAAKMALKCSGTKPYQWLYDGQGGHKAKDSQDFFDRAVKLHFPAQPYNAKSKPIENLIGRLQKQVMQDRWFFTGQNIQSKRLDSKPNIEFVLAHKDQLPTLEEVLLYAEEDVRLWNERSHPNTGLARMAMYKESESPVAEPLDFIDYVELFWLTKQKPIRYTNEGLTLEVGGQRLKYEVYDEQGIPSVAFLRRWTNASFVVRYDPEQLSGGVMLYRADDNGLRLITRAALKKTYARAAVDLKPGERGEIDTNLALRKAQEEAIRAELEALRSSTGLDPETLVTIGYRGDKEGMDEAEGSLLRRHLNDDDEEDINPISLL